MYRVKNLCLILGFFLLLLTGCNDKSDVEAGISSFSYFNSDGDILAVLVGFKLKGQDRPAVLETRPVLLEFNAKSLLKSYQPLEDWVVRDMAWRPAHDNQLYYMTFEKVFNTDDNPFGSFYDNSTEKWFKRGTGNLIMFEANSDDNSSTTISQNARLNAIRCFNWSPNGKILAGSITQSNQVYGELVVSFDGGKTFESTEIKMAGYPAWTNDKELYLGTSNNTILKVLWDGQNFIVKEELTKDFRIGLRGSFQEKPVYVAWPCKDDKGEYLDETRRLFVGDTLIYETKEQYPKVFVFTDNIVVEADKKVMIFDENLSVCHEKHLARKTHLLNFQPNTNTVFLTKGWKTILSYDYTKKRNPRVLFSVDMLNEPSS